MRQLTAAGSEACPEKTERTEKYIKTVFGLSRIMARLQETTACGRYFVGLVVDFAEYDELQAAEAARKRRAEAVADQLIAENLETL